MRAAAVLVALLFATPAHADEPWRAAIGLGYRASIDAGDADTETAHAPVARYRFGRVLAGPLWAFAELELPVPFLPDGGFVAGGGLGLDLPLGRGRTAVGADGRSNRTRWLALVRLAGGFAVTYNDRGFEGYDLSDGSFTSTGPYLRFEAGPAWSFRAEGARAGLTLALVPGVTVERGDPGGDRPTTWRLGPGASFMIGFRW